MSSSLLFNEIPFASLLVFSFTSSLSIYSFLVVFRYGLYAILVEPFISGTIRIGLFVQVRFLLIAANIFEEVLVIVVSTSLEFVNSLRFNFC